MIQWLQNNPDYAAAIVLALIYVARSIMPRRPDPSWPAWALLLWRIEQRLLALPWDRWFGRPKLPGLIVPEYDPWDPREAPTKREPRQ